MTGHNLKVLYYKMIGQLPQPSSTILNPCCTSLIFLDMQIIAIISLYLTYKLTDHLNNNKNESTTNWLSSCSGILTTTNWMISYDLPPHRGLLWLQNSGPIQVCRVHKLKQFVVEISRGIQMNIPSIIRILNTCKGVYVYTQECVWANMTSRISNNNSLGNLSTSQRMNDHAHLREDSLDPSTPSTPQILKHFWCRVFGGANPCNKKHWTPQLLSKHLAVSTSNNFSSRLFLDSHLSEVSEVPFLFLPMNLWWNFLKLLTLKLT